MAKSQRGGHSPDFQAGPLQDRSSTDLFGCHPQLCSGRGGQHGGGDPVCRAPASSVMRPATRHVAVPSCLMEEAWRHLQSGSQEAPPPGPGRGLGGLARAAPVRWPRWRCSKMTSARCRTVMEDGALRGRSPPQIDTGTAMRHSGRPEEGQRQSQVQPERSSSSSKRES